MYKVAFSCSSFFVVIVLVAVVFVVVAVVVAVACTPAAAPAACLLTLLCFDTFCAKPIQFEIFLLNIFGERKQFFEIRAVRNSSRCP